MSENKLQVTSLNEIKEKATPIIELPGWDVDQSFHARVRRVSMLSLISGGHLPNDLLAIAYKLVNNEKGENPFKTDDPEDIAKFADLMQHVARITLVDPTYDEIIEATGGLTDRQIQALFLYATQGANALKIFRDEPGPLEEDGIHSEGVGQSA